MRRLLMLIAAVVGLIALGCGGSGESAPTACLEGQSLYLGRGDGEVLISECLAPNQSAGELATVGTAMLSAATRLNAEAREDPGGAANLQLGLLLGAAQRGAEGTEGIHDELVRRLAAAARYSPDNRPLPAVFLATYRRGFDAGVARG